LLLLHEGMPLANCLSCAKYMQRPPTEAEKKKSSKVTGDLKR
jgi:hypothetical protein